MRILLIAHEFPPSPSPQSLRWYYLSRELVALGVDVHVLTAEDGHRVSWLHPPQGVKVHRVPAGGMGGLIRAIRGRRGREAEAAAAQAMAATPPAPVDFSATADTSKPPVLNWKGRLVARADRLHALLTFPDHRGSWESPARRRLAALLETVRPDVVVSSHEPATSLRLGLLAKARGFRWVADLGDPVLSFYTPRRWRRTSLRLERETCRQADHVTVTAEHARELLARRHGIPPSRTSVVTQGFDATGPVSPLVAENSFGEAALELLYSGSFYDFRQPRVLVEGVLSVPGVRLSIATHRVPDWLPPLIEAHPDQLRLLGFLPHDLIRALQRSADVLVNIGNDDSTHVPGKVYEYLGAGRPILHLGGQDDDTAADLLRKLRRGVVCGNDAREVATALGRLVEIKHGGSWDDAFDLSPAAVAGYEWSALARRMQGILQNVCRD